MGTIFIEQICQNLEVYIDDMVIKNLEKGRHEENMRETLAFVRKTTCD